MEENENITNVEEQTPPPVIEKVSLKEILDEKLKEDKENSDRIYNEFIEIIKSIPAENLENFIKYCDYKLKK